VRDFYGHLDVAQRERLLALPCDELVIVDSALRPDGVAEEWRWLTGERLAEELGGGTVLHDGPWFVAVRGSSRRS
jgi:hypothetical protein